MKRAAPAQVSPRAIVITGTPGTGKTAVSKSLAREIGADYLCLTRLVIEKRLHSATDVPRRTRVLDLRRTRECVREFISGRKKMVVVDTHVPDAIPREYVGNVIVLRCHPAALRARLRRKRWGGGKIRENVLAEILDSCYTSAVAYYGARRIAQLDTSRLSVGKTVRQSKKILKNQVSGKAGVDWIRVLNRDHSLERYVR